MGALDRFFLIITIKQLHAVFLLSLPVLLEEDWRTGEPVRPSGKAGKRRDLGSNPLRLSFLFKSCGLWTLSCDLVPHSYETLKCLSLLPTLMQESFWW